MRQSTAELRFETVEIVVVRGVETIAARFHPPERITGIRSLGSGNVNDTYLVTHADRGCGAFVLQRLNTRVFHRPDLVMRNLEALGSHVQRRLASPPPRAGGTSLGDPSGCALPSAKHLGRAQRRVLAVDHLHRCRHQPKRDSKPQPCP